MNSKQSPPRTVPHEYHRVFDVLVATLQQERFTIGVADRANGAIQCNSGVNWRTWGESLLIRLGATDATATTIQITSQLKMGLVDWGRHDANFRRIFDALDRNLLPQAPPQPPRTP